MVTPTHVVVVILPLLPRIELKPKLDLDLVPQPVVIHALYVVVHAALKSKLLKKLKNERSQAIQAQLPKLCKLGLPDTIDLTWCTGPSMIFPILCFGPNPDHSAIPPSLDGC